MKYTKIGRLCVKMGTLYIYEKDGVQYVSDGSALFSLDRMPKMTESQLCTFLEINPEKVVVSDKGAPPINVDDNTVKDIIIDHEGLGCQIGHFSVIAFFTDEGAVCIDSRYLKPFEDEEDIMYFLRDDNVVVKNGMYYLATICPIEVSRAEDIDKYSMLVYQLDVAKRKHDLRHGILREEDEDV